MAGGKDLMCVSDVSLSSFGFWIVLNRLDGLVCGIKKSCQSHVKLVMSVGFKRPSSRTFRYFNPRTERSVRRRSVIIVQHIRVSPLHHFAISV